MNDEQSDNDSNAAALKREVKSLSGERDALKGDLESACRERDARAKERDDLQRALDSRLGWSALCAGALVLAVGASVIFWTMTLRGQERSGYLGRNPGAGTLSHGEFVAGITGGCLLIVAVVVGATFLGMRIFRSGQPHL